MRAAYSEVRSVESRPGFLDWRLQVAYTAGSRADLGVIQAVWRCDDPRRWLAGRTLSLRMERLIGIPST